MAIIKGFEPLLLSPIAFGCILANMPKTGFEDSPGVMQVILYCIHHEIFPPLIFLGVGAMTDFGPLIANPKVLLLGAAAGSQCDSLLNEISNAEEKQFVLYPNPALEFIKIHFNHFESYQATIFDLNGKILKKENLSGNEEQILNLNEFASGIYFLKIETEKNHFYKRFIKE